MTIRGIICCMLPTCYFVCTIIWLFYNDNASLFMLMNEPGLMINIENTSMMVELHVSRSSKF